jgi:hypothetical protein
LRRAVVLQIEVIEEEELLPASTLQEANTAAEQDNVKAVKIASKVLFFIIISPFL